ncbi:MAG: FYDLN acid domain-containing protein [Hyphomicrobiaceae bacterium]|nr:FYDLN acid domain-containing protein [Hyphomicrobiaceae bacterium]
MATTERRGLKRRCQNDSCALPFYDLNRTNFSCPNCGAVFDLAIVARALEAQQARSQSSRFNNRRQAPVLPIVEPAAEPVADLVVEEDAVEEGTEAATSDILLEEVDGDGDLELGVIDAEDGDGKDE